MFHCVFCFVCVSQWGSWFPSLKTLCRHIKVYEHGCTIFRDLGTSFLLLLMHIKSEDPHKCFTLGPSFQSHTAGKSAFINSSCWFPLFATNIMEPFWAYFWVNTWRPFCGTFSYKHDAIVKVEKKAFGHLHWGAGLLFLEGQSQSFNAGWQLFFLVLLCKFFFLYRTCIPPTLFFHSLRIEILLELILMILRVRVIKCS